VRFYNALLCSNSSTLAKVLKADIVMRKKEEKKRKTSQAAKSSSHQLRKRGHLGRKAPSPEKKRGGQ